MVVFTVLHGLLCRNITLVWHILSPYYRLSTNIFFLIGDYNVAISPLAEIKLMTEACKNILLSKHFYPLINQPTRESKLSHTIIDNIYCNIPIPLEMSDIGFLRPYYTSDHNAILCMLHDITVNNVQHSCIKRNFGGGGGGGVIFQNS